MNRRKSNIENIFKQTFNSKPELFVVTPSRINIIGEHIDYLGGNVFLANINLYLTAAFSKSEKINFFSNDFAKEGVKSFPTNKKYSYDTSYGFMNYVLGCYQILNEKGYNVSGFSVSVMSEIPSSSGLSSSAAFGVMLLKGISELYGHHLDGKEIAILFKEVENNFLKLKNGIMDQFIIANGKKDKIMLLNTNTLEYSNYEIDLDKYNFLVINSKKPRNLVDSKYNERVDETTLGLKEINKKYNFENICSISIEQKDEVLSLINNPTIKKRVKFAIEENNRVKRFIEATKTKDYVAMGNILNEGHNGLSKEYEVSCAELDFVNNIGKEIDGVLGVRKTGAGFGGCLIALVEKAKNDLFKNTLIEKYKQEFNYPCEVYEIEVVDAAKVIK